MFTTGGPAQASDRSKLGIASPTIDCSSLTFSDQPRVASGLLQLSDSNFSLLRLLAMQVRDRQPHSLEGIECVVILERWMIDAESAEGRSLFHRGFDLWTQQELGIFPNDAMLQALSITQAEGPARICGARFATQLRRAGIDLGSPDSDSIGEQIAIFVRNSLRTAEKSLTSAPSAGAVSSILPGAVVSIFDDNRAPHINHVYALTFSGSYRNAAEFGWLILDQSHLGYSLKGPVALPVLEHRINAVLDARTIGAPQHPARRVYFHGPETRTFKDGKSTVNFEAPCIRVPFGTLGSCTTYLQRIQHEISSGKVASACVRISGPLDPQFVKRIVGHSPTEPGQFPGIEFRYLLPLPEGGTYEFAIKRSHLAPPRDPESTPLSERDRNVVERLNHYYFGLSDRSQFFEIFRWDRTPPDAVGIDWREADAAISEPARLKALRMLWLERVWREIEAIRPSRIEDERDHHLDSRYADRGAFNMLLRSYVEGLPTIFAQHPAAKGISLSLGDVDRFMARHADRLYELCCAERLRVQQELISEAPRQWQELGYHGPPGGIPLSLIWAIVDGIRHDQAIEHYCRVRSIEEQRTVTEAEVPSHIGCRYDHLERFLTLTGLAAAVRSANAPRTVEATLFDPLNDTTTTITDLAQVRAIGPITICENYRRMATVARAMLNSGNLAQQRPLPFSEVRRSQQRAPINEYLEKGNAFSSRAMFVAMHRTVQEYLLELAQSEARLVSLRKQRGAELAAASRHRRTVPGPTRHAQTVDLKKEWDWRIQQEEGNLIHRMEQFLRLAAAIFPKDYPRYCIQLQGIRDSCRQLYIYVCRAEDNQWIFHRRSLSPRDNIPLRKHSEGAGGKGVRVAGELCFATHDNLFMDFARWAAFDQEVATQGLPQMQPQLATNGSGHYVPKAVGLVLLRNTLFPELSKLGFDTSKIKLVDQLGPGAHFRGYELY